MLVRTLNFLSLNYCLPHDSIAHLVDGDKKIIVMKIMIIILDSKA